MFRRDAVLVAVAGLLAFGLAGCGGKPLPRDEELIEHFEAHHAEFDSLALLLERDTTIRFLPVVIHVPDSRESFTPEQVRRREDLQRRMKRLGLWGLEMRDGPSMEFPAAEDWTGAQKSYVYFTVGPRRPKLVASLDEASVEPWSLRHVDGKWYLWLNLGD